MSIMTNEPSYSGRCFCGAVELRVTGEPAAMGFCHCEACRQWSAGPINGFTLWRPNALQVVQGAGQIETYSKTPRSARKWCTRCGGHLFTEHPAWELVDVYAATIPDFPFKPALHVNYQETVLRIRDGLPKLRDLPKDMGGSGELLPE
jgi:hypothetical protein